MPLFKIAWVTSWVSFLLTSSLGLFKVPDYFSGRLPTRVFSTVGSPIEKLTPSTAATSLASTSRYFLVWKADSSLALETNTGLTQFSLSQIVGRRSIAWLNAGENAFCRPASQPQEELMLVSNVSKHQSALVGASQNQVSQAGFPQKLTRMMQNLFGWSKPMEPQVTPSPVVVVSTRQSIQTRKTAAGKERKARQSQWLPSRQRERSATDKQSSDQQEFQVWVKGNLVAQVSDQQQADLIAQRLDHLLSEPDFDAFKVKPALVQGKPAGKMGDRFLFVVDEAIATEDEPNLELLAIQWVNNLRVALNAPPLEIVEAQRQMYGLVETSVEIEGLASWYGSYFHGRLTATGETFDQNALTAAHPSLPFNTYLKVTNLENQDSVIVRINDRGPYIDPRNLDLSRAAARCINSKETGVVPYKAMIMEPSSRVRLDI